MQNNREEWEAHQSTDGTEVWSCYMCTKTLVSQST